MVQEHKKDEFFTSPHPQYTQDHALPLWQLSKVRSGQVGESKDRVPDEIQQELDDIWINEIKPRTGLNSYEDLRKELMN
ncbi:MAG: hypothetical protein U0Z26_08530 [Anaerolineales bacterium]